MRVIEMYLSLIVFTGSNKPKDKGRKRTHLWMRIEGLYHRGQLLSRLLQQFGWQSRVANPCRAKIERFGLACSLEIVIILSSLPTIRLKDNPFSVYKGLLLTHSRYKSELFLGLKE